MTGSSGRGARRRFAAGLVIAAALVATGVGLNALSASGGSPPSGPLRVVGPMRGFPGAYVRGSGFYRAAGIGRASLAASVSTPLAGSLAPVAVSSSDGRYVAYNSWRTIRQVDQAKSFGDQGIQDGEPLGTPSLRLYDTTTGRDSLLETGAMTIAWRGDGAVAYARAADPDLRAGQPYLGQIVVRPSPRGPGIRWTDDPGRYVVYGWAGSRLVAYRIGDGEQLETLVLDGPGRVRALTDGAVVAIGPDGTQALVVAADGLTLRLVSLADGAESGRLDVAQPVAYSGSWRGDTAVAATASGLDLFRISSGRIALDQELALDPATFPAGAQEPEFVDANGNRIVATVQVPPAEGKPALNMLLECNRITRSCERGDAAPATEWVRLVRDPSKPKRGER